MRWLVIEAVTILLEFRAFLDHSTIATAATGGCYRLFENVHFFRCKVTEPMSAWSFAALRKYETLADIPEIIDWIQSFSEEI